MKEEIWKDVNGYEGHYQVSNLGGIRNLLRKYNLKPSKSKKHGYYRVNLHNKVNGELLSKTKYIHVLIADAFLCNDYLSKGLFCNHIDGDKSNNALVNLEIVTKSENEKHAFRIGLKCHKGDNHNSRKLCFNDVKEIRNLITKGEATKIIARKYNISIMTVYGIKHNRSWNY